MVARIKTPNHIRRALNYNEQKVTQGRAELLHAANYLKDAHELNFKEKFKRFQDLISLNERAKTNSLHISLNFDNSDKLTKEKLVAIGQEYMSKIGFAEQPYLLYQHIDAGHPHIHIVTTTIKADGRRIDTFNIGRNQSEKARKEIEQKFHLIQAGKKHLLNYDLKPINIEKVQYGKAEIKRAITNVLDHVLPAYKYASLAELNAILKQYNIIADRGNERSRIYKTKGLIYRILDGNGDKIGVPIKASLIYSKPILKSIEARFESNGQEREMHKQRIRNAIDFSVFKKSNLSLQELIKALQKEKTQVVLRQNANGVIYGITYIDHHTKCVFNGSHLGKQYSANEIQQRCNAGQLMKEPIHQTQQPSNSQSQEQLTERQKQPFKHSANSENINQSTLATGISKVLDDLINPDLNQNANEPFEQKKFKRKRKRKQQQSHN